MPRSKDCKPGCEEYKREWEYQKKTGDNKKNTERAKARRMYDKLGIDRKGKHIDHIKPLESGGKTTKGNLRLVSVSTNVKKNLHKKGEKKGK
jgi:hypothetical protein